MFNCVVLCLIVLFYVLFVSIVLFYVFVCVHMCTVLPPLGVNSTAVNNHIKYLPPGRHVGQPWAKISILRL
jgi:hypothetical protein